MKRAVVYHAYCEPNYVRLAVISAESAKWHMPDVDTILFTEMAVDGGFDRIIRADPVPLALARFPPLLKLPADYTSAIYFDCDSYVCAPLYDVFDLVEDARTDVALVLQPRRDTYVYPGAGGVPEAYPQFGESFVAFQNSAKVQEFFAAWSRLFHEHQRRYHEEPESPWAGKPFTAELPMRIACYHSDLTIVPLPPKYHLLDGLVAKGVVRSFAAPKGADQRVLAEISRAVNCSDSSRLFFGGRGYQVGDILTMQRRGKSREETTKPRRSIQRKGKSQERVLEPGPTLQGKEKSREETIKFGLCAKCKQLLQDGPNINVCKACSKIIEEGEG